MTNEPRKEVKNNTIHFDAINLIHIGIALIIPPVVCYFIVLLFTNSIGLISRQLWTLPIIWPEQLYLGGTIGGFLGGLVGIWEIWMINRQKREATPGKMLSSDLYYIIILIGFTYVLQFLSDSLVPQIIFFLLEVGFFLIVGWNLIKVLLEAETKEYDQKILKPERIEEENSETEKYMSE